MIDVEFRGTLRPLYMEFLQHPPESIRYIISNDEHRLAVQAKIRKAGVLGAIGTRMFRRLHYSGIVPLRLWHVSNYWPHHLLQRDFVNDTENAGTFTENWSFQQLSSSTFRERLRGTIASPRCKRILPLTYAAYETMRSFIDEDAARKVQVVYPAIQPSKMKHCSDDKVRILFVGNSFLDKGGRELLASFRKLKQIYRNLELTIISAEYAVSTEKRELGVKVLGSTNRDTVLAHFALSDIFCMPTYCDSFGFVFLEAKAASIPIVSTRHFHMPELVKDGVTGFLVDPPVSCWKADFTYDHSWKARLLTSNLFEETVDQLTDKLSILIEDEGLRQRMGQTGYEETVNGKFSFAQRNRVMKTIYEEATTP